MTILVLGRQETDLSSLTSSDQNCRIETLSEVKHDQELPVYESSISAHVAIRVRGIENLGDVSSADTKEGDGSPTSQEGEEQEETKNIRAGSLGYGTVGVVSI